MIKIKLERWKEALRLEVVENDKTKEINNKIEVINE